MERIDAILILGHRLEPDDSPSEDQVRRIDCAVEHWKQTNAPVIMPCGGLTPGHQFTEAEVMQRLLIERGVPQEIIHLEDRSRITIENVRNAVALLGEGRRVALVTSDYHVNAHWTTAAVRDWTPMALARLRPRASTATGCMPRKPALPPKCRRRANPA